jgi:hypothetical protein
MAVPKQCSGGLQIHHTPHSAKEVYRFTTQACKHQVDSKSPNHRVHRDWQCPIFGVQSIMMEKSALAGEGGGGGARPPPFTLVTITYKVAVYAPTKRADTLPLFHLYPYM